MQSTFYDDGVRCSLSTAPGLGRCVIHNTASNTLSHEPTPIDHPSGSTHATQADNPWPPMPITHENPPNSWVKPITTHEIFRQAQDSTQNAAGRERKVLIGNRQPAIVN